MDLSLISWRCIFAGAATAIAVSIVMAILGVALGFTVVKPTSNEPFSGLGTAFGVWGIVSVVLSLAAGGFVAGLTSGLRGHEHGFLVWAIVLIAGTLFSGLAVGAAAKGVGAAVRGVGSAVAGVGSGAVSVASGLGDSVSDMASSAVSQLRENMHINVDSNEFAEDVRSVLQDTGVESLQPENLNRQMREAHSDLKGALHQLALAPGNYESIIDGFVEKQKSRLDDITGDVDRDAAVTALMENRDIARPEAERMVDNAIGVYNRAVTRARETVDEAQRQLVATREHIRTSIADARVKADEFASSAARSALAGGVALIIGAVIACFAGYYGARYSGRDAVIYESRAQVGIPLERKIIERP